MTRTILLLLTTLLALPPASAGWFDRDDATTVHVPLQRAGDEAQYAQHLVRTRFERDPSTNGFTERREEMDRMHVVLVEGAARAADGYGIERDTFAFRRDRFEKGALLDAVRCHALAGGRESVALEALSAVVVGGSASWSTFPAPGVTSQRTEAQRFLAVRHDGAPCFGHDALAGRALRPGDRVPMHDLAGSMGFEREDDAAWTEPAVAATFHGRAALNFTFYDDASEAQWWAVVADGLPAPAILGRVDGPDDADRLELVGVRAGDGATLAPPSDARLPTRDPNGRFVPADRLAFDDRALDLAFPYRDAYAALLGQPGSKLKAYVDAHPDAWLTRASYERTSPGASLTGRDSADGWWTLRFTDGRTVFDTSIARDSVSASGTRTPLPPVPMDDPTRPTQSRERTLSTPMLTLPAGTQLADTGTLVARAKAAGVMPASPEMVSFGLIVANDGTPRALLTIDELPLSTQRRSDRGEGKALMLDPVAGSILQVTTTSSRRETTGLLAPPGGSLDAKDSRSFAALSALVGPGLGSGLAAGGAAAGLGVLALLVKFLLVPFYTRLRRATLLDNPVRARLYDRIRQDPGIHQAELVDFAGVGRGATERHLRQLAHHRFVVELRADGRLRYYAAGEVPRELALQHAALRSQSARAVYELLTTEPHLSLRETGARLRLSAPTVHRAKKRLAKAGLLR